MKIEMIMRILNNWNLGNIKHIEKAEKGVVNHNWIVKTSSGKYVLRMLPKDRKLKNLMFELRYINYLDKKGLDYQLPKALKTKIGKETIRYGGNYVWLYRFIEGHVKDSFGKKELKEMAKMMANYHSILENFNIKNGAGKSKPYVKDLILKESEEFKKKISKKKDKEDIIYLEEIKKLLPILMSLDSKKYGKLKQYPIHRDLNPENVLWQGNKLTGIIDFENVSSINEPLIKDLSIVLQLGCSKDGERLNVAKARYFIKEYNKFKKISYEELRILPSIIAATYIEDFNYAYWMLKNDPERAKLYRLKKYSNAAQWFWKNKDKLAEELQK